MSGMELTTVTAAAFILFALERIYRVYANSQQKTIECLETIAGLVQEIRNDARECNAETTRDRLELTHRLDNFEGSFDGIQNILSDIDMALHGDYRDGVRKKLNCLSNIEDSSDDIRKKLNILSNIEDYLEGVANDLYQGCDSAPRLRGSPDDNQGS